MKEEGEEDGEESATLEEEQPAMADSEPLATAASADPDAEEKTELSATTQQLPVDTTPSQQATDTKTTTGDDSSAADQSTPEANISKDPSSSSSSSSSSSGAPPEESAAAAPAEGFIQGLLEIHAKPPLEHLLPNGEPPLVGAD